MVFLKKVYGNRNKNMVHVRHWQFARWTHESQTKQTKSNIMVFRHNNLHKEDHQTFIRFNHKLLWVLPLWFRVESMYSEFAHLELTYINRA